MSLTARSAYSHRYREKTWMGLSRKSTPSVLEKALSAVLLHVKKPASPVVFTGAFSVIMCHRRG